MGSPLGAKMGPPVRSGVSLLSQVGNGPVATPKGQEPGSFCGVQGVSFGPPGPAWISRFCARTTQLSSQLLVQQYGSLRQTHTQQLTWLQPLVVCDVKHPPLAARYAPSRLGSAMACCGTPVVESPSSLVCELGYGITATVPSTNAPSPVTLQVRSWLVTSRVPVQVARLPWMAMSVEEPKSKGPRNAKHGSYLYALGAWLAPPLGPSLSYTVPPQRMFAYVAHTASQPRGSVRLEQ